MCDTVMSAGNCSPIIAILQQRAQLAHCATAALDILGCMHTILVLIDYRMSS